MSQDKLLSELNKGNWDIATAYTVGDFVSRTGSSYVCILNNTAQVPPNTDYWALIAQAGTDGTNGADGLMSEDEVIGLIIALS